MAEPGGSTYRHGLGFQDLAPFMGATKKPLARGWQRLWYFMSYAKSLVGIPRLRKLTPASSAMTTNNTCHSNNNQRDDGVLALT
jgi:hypothetical protein